MRIFLSHTTESVQQAGHRHVLLLLILAMVLGGCMSGYGTIASSSRAAAVLADAGSMANYTLYVYGNPDAPTAVAGLTGEYRMKTKTWKQAAAGEIHPDHLSRLGGLQGYDIRSGDGLTVGFMATSIREYTVKVDTEAKVVELIPIVRVGGGK